LEHGAGSSADQRDLRAGKFLLSAFARRWQAARSTVIAPENPNRLAARPWDEQTGKSGNPAGWKACPATAGPAFGQILR
jgi:hypothetical protein